MELPAPHPDLVRIAAAVDRWAANLPMHTEPSAFQSALDRGAPADEPGR
jgi:hypothetical protein